MYSVPRGRAGADYFTLLGYRQDGAPPPITLAVGAVQWMQLSDQQRVTVVVEQSVNIRSVAAVVGPQRE